MVASKDPSHVDNHKSMTKLKLTDSKLCTFCKLEAEIIEHLFVDCPYVKEIWDAVEDMLLNRFNIHIATEKNNIFFEEFNTCNMYKVENLLIFVIKLYFYSTKILNTDAILRLITERISIC